MIINFSIPGAARADLMARPLPAATVIAPNPARVRAARRPQMVCRWIADPVSGALHAIWQYSDAQNAAASAVEDPDRLCLAA